MANLTNKTALVTGASRGIGAAIAKRLAADGASVAITYSKGATAAAQVVKDIEEAGGKAIAIQADATDAKAVNAAVEQLAKTFGRLDILVNNAGTAIPKPFEEATLEELNTVIDINLRVHRHAGRAQAPVGWRSHHQYRLLCRRAEYDAGPGSLCRNQRRGENVHARTVA
jgi:NAD(P)-dependent dehydrogenase (short-subunit alcohol dehydrogenase family)